MASKHSVAGKMCGYKMAHSTGSFTNEKHQHYTMHGGGENSDKGMKYDMNGKKAKHNKEGGMKVRMQGKGTEKTGGQKAVQADTKGKFSDNIYSQNGK